VAEGPKHRFAMPPWVFAVCVGVVALAVLGWWLRGTSTVTTPGERPSAATSGAPSTVTAVATAPLTLAATSTHAPSVSPPIATATAAPTTTAPATATATPSTPTRSSSPAGSGPSPAGADAQPAYPTLAGVRAVVTSHEIGGAGVAIEVTALILGTTREGLTCTATSTDGVRSASGSAPAVFDGRGLSCGTMQVALPEPATGVWTTTVTVPVDGVTVRSDAVTDRR